MESSIFVYYHMRTARKILSHFGIYFHAKARFFCTPLPPPSHYFGRNTMLVRWLDFNSFVNLKSLIETPLNPTHPDMTFIRCSYSFLRVYPQGAFRLLRRDRTRGGSLVHTSYMTRESTHFWRRKKKRCSIEVHFYKKKIHWAFFTCKVLS